MYAPPPPNSGPPVVAAAPAPVPLERWAEHHPQAARELGDHGIRVNCIAPGLTMSDGTRNNKSWTDAARAANVASRSLKRDAEPADLVGALLFLASADSAFMTGQTLAVDGGSVML